MVSRPQTRAQIIDAIESTLVDTTNATWSAARLGLLLDDVITEVSESVPYVMRDTYTIESRTGIASSTSSGNLVDATKSQFVSGDTGKVVYNTTDHTWAVIESYSSATQVGVSADIMASGEGYEIYNKGCWSKKQVNIANSSDFLKVLYAVYPIDRHLYAMPSNRRNVFLHDQNKILELDIAYVEDSGVSTSFTDVNVFFARQHKLNPMTDLAGAANAQISAGATSAAIKGLTDADSYVYKDTLFTVALASGISSRYTYRVTADAAISTNIATVSFYPAMEAVVDADAVVTFVGSTLTPELERIIVQIVAGEALISESINLATSLIQGSGSSSQYYNIGERITAKARAKLKALIDIDQNATYSYSRG
uniref:Uncharacterized protein n=1 Tax=viral metagenome TaxID=1070528 RepID=A0A6M3KM91_9ZZZZ